MSRRVRLLISAVVLVVLVVGIVQVLGKSKKPDQTSMPLAEQQARLRGAPAPLAAIHAQASQLLDGGADAFHARLTALQQSGHAVVINKWGSWCGPCRLEFPVFQRVAVTLGKQVAFLGIDGEDPLGDAKAYLAKTPLSYPSYRDPKDRIAQSIEAGKFFPTTVFVDAHGNRTVHQGPYDDEAALERDIRRYALGLRA